MQFIKGKKLNTYIFTYRVGFVNKFKKDAYNLIIRMIKIWQNQTQEVTLIYNLKPIFFKKWTVSKDIKIKLLHIYIFTDTLKKILFCLSGLEWKS